MSMTTIAIIDLKNMQENYEQEKSDYPQKSEPIVFFGNMSLFGPMR